MVYNIYIYHIILLCIYIYIYISYLDHYISRSCCLCWLPRRVKIHIIWSGDSPPLPSLPGIANLTWKWSKKSGKCRTSKNETSWNSMEQTIVDLSVALRNTGKHYAKWYIRICRPAPKPDKQTKVGHIRIWQWTQFFVYFCVYRMLTSWESSLSFSWTATRTWHEAKAGSSADTFPAGLEAAQHLKSWAMSCDQPRPRMALGIDKSQDLVT